VTPSYPLYVNANGTPQTGYEVGIGPSTTWGTPAPAATTGLYDDVFVQSVNPSNDSFVACNYPVWETGNCYTFTYGAANSFYIYEYNDGLLSVPQFVSYLSATNEPFLGGPYAAPTEWGGDTLSINYNASGPSEFNFVTDIPAAPTAVTAAPVTSGPDAGLGYISVSWTAPVNPDVALYNVWRAEESTTGTYDWTTATNVGSCTSSAASPCSDTTAPAAGTYEYAVDASDGSTTYFGALSAPSAPVTIAAPAAPVIVTVLMSPNSALVTYNEDVTCAANAGLHFTYSNTGGVGPVVGTSCAPETGQPTELTIALPALYAPVTDDTFTYTVPTLETVADAVYAGTVSSPVYAATQIVTDNGTGTSPLS
jgi:hypothetical protein